MAPRFLPTARQMNWLIAVALLSLGYAIYVRYMILENVQAGLGCDAGLKTWLCTTRQVAIPFGERNVFGTAALCAALLTFIRPGVVLMAIALATTAAGLVLHDADFAGVAAGFIVLSLARPAPASE